MAILGIDEVGRGPLAGPLVVGAVVLPEPWPEWVEELRDSKKLTAKKREKLAGIINEETAVGLGFVTVYELDGLGMTAALELATRRAVREAKKVGAKFSEVIIDGKMNFLRGTPLERYVTTVIKADDKIKEVAAASIVAKVARDGYMKELAAKYPEYGFEKHMGYGTAKHIAAIREKGICPEHRRSFEPVKSMIGFERETRIMKNTTGVGQRGEAAVCEFLERGGHEIIARNFKTYLYEIDIVSVRDGKMYFTEVKTRKNDAHGGGMAAIDRRKLKRMEFAAESFWRMRRGAKEYDPVLAAADVIATSEEFVVKEWVEIK